MANCANCNYPMNDDATFCPSCGATVTAAPSAPPVQQAAPTPPPVQQAAPPVYGQQPPVQQAPPPVYGQQAPAYGAKSDAQDAQDNKVMAVLAYFGILVLVPLLGAKESKFARFHANQGLVLLIFSFAASIAIGILSTIFAFVSTALVLITSLLSFALGIFVLVLMIMGIVNAAKGEMKPLPLIGKFTILK